MAGPSFTAPKINPWTVGDGSSAQFNQFIRTPLQELQDAATPGAWQTLSPLTGGAAQGVPPVQFRKEGGGASIRLIGRISHPALTAGSPITIGTLPAGSRPAVNGIYSCSVAVNTVTRIDIGDDGQIILRATVGSGTPTTTVFDGITFPTP